MQDKNFAEFCTIQAQTIELIIVFFLLYITLILSKLILQDFCSKFSNTRNSNADSMISNNA